METFLLKSENRITENRGPFSIHHCYDSKKYNIPIAEYFKNLVSIRDCEIEPNMGILPHRLENMELITIPISGTLVQKNNLGETFQLEPGNVLIMNGGPGISHFEYNKCNQTKLNCIQFCIVPKTSSNEPKNQIICLETKKIGFQKIIPSSEIDVPQIEGELYLYYGFLKNDTSKNYQLKNNKGLLILNVSGEIEINGESLKSRDTLALKDISEITIVSKKTAEFFIFEI